MFLTNWSLTGGDMRVPHFVGLHGIQVLIIVTVLLAVLVDRYTWLRAERVRAGLVRWFAVGYLGLFLTLAWQAVRGQSVVDPDGVTLAALAASVGIGLTGLLVTTRRAARERRVGRGAGLHGCRWGGSVRGSSTRVGWPTATARKRTLRGCVTIPPHDPRRWELTDGAIRH